MATGIISVGLHLTGFEVISVLMLAPAGVVWAFLAIDFVRRLVWNRTRWETEAETPAALTAVAATTVLGTRISLLGWYAPAFVLLALASVVWPVLLYLVIGHWNRHMPGAAFLVCVSTEGLAVLAGTLAVAGRGDALVPAALVLACLGVLLYLAALSRFDVRQLWSGAGDQWIAAGALAITALAFSKLTASHYFTGAAHDLLRGACLVILALNLIVYAVLVVTEVVDPRPADDVRRWATVFPLGMTAVATLSAGAAAGISWLRPVGSGLLIVAVGAWLLTLVVRARRITA